MTIEPVSETLLNKFSDNSFTLNQLSLLIYQSSEVSVGNIADIIVLEFIDFLKDSNAVDAYNLTTKLIQSIKDRSIRPLTKVSNQCIIQSCFPNSLKRAKVLSLLKRKHDLITNRF